MRKAKKTSARAPSKRAKAKTLRTIRLLRKLQKTGLIESSGYSLEMPFSKRLSASGTINYLNSTNTP